MVSHVRSACARTAVQETTGVEISQQAQRIDLLEWSGGLRAAVREQVKSRARRKEPPAWAEEFMDEDIWGDFLTLGPRLCKQLLQKCVL